MYTIKNYSWIIDNNQDKLLASPRNKEEIPTQQDRLSNAPRIPSDIISNLESQIEALSLLVTSIKECCEFVIDFCNDIEAMKRYIQHVEGKQQK